MFPSICFSADEQSKCCGQCSSDSCNYCNHLVKVALIFSFFSASPPPLFNTLKICIQAITSVVLWCAMLSAFLRCHFTDVFVIVVSFVECHKQLMRLSIFRLNWNYNHAKHHGWHSSTEQHSWAVWFKSLEQMEYTTCRWSGIIPKSGQFSSELMAAMFKDRYGAEVKPYIC